MTETLERSVKEETENVILEVLEKSYPKSVKVLNREMLNAERIKIMLCMKKTKYKIDSGWVSINKGEAIVVPLSIRPEFMKNSEVVSVKIRKMIVDIDKNFLMPTTLLCSEDRYQDFYIHSDIERLLVSQEDEETCLLLRLIFHSVEKLIKLNNSGILNSAYAKFLSAMTYIGDNVEKSLNRVELASSLDICSDYLNTLFKRYHGASFSQYTISRKMEYSRRLLKSGLKIAEIAKKLSYKSDVHYSTIFKKTYGLSPKKIQLLMLKKRALTVGETEKLYRRVGFETLEALDGEEECRLGKMNPALRSNNVDLCPLKNYVILFENISESVAEVFWLDEAGERVSHGAIKPGQRKESSTQSNRVWVVESADHKSVYLSKIANCMVLFN